MSILLLRGDISGRVPCPQVTLCNCETARGVSLKGGPPVAHLLPAGFHVEIDDGEVEGLTDFIPGIGFVLVSQKLRNVLEARHAEVEYIPVPALYRERLVQGYFLANPLRVVRGVDLEASSIELNGVGIAMSVDRLVLEESLFAGIPLCVVDEIDAVAVQSEVAQAIVAAGCTGGEFADPATFTL